jgi:hypothetical protein
MSGGLKWLYFAEREIPAVGAGAEILLFAGERASSF